MQRIDPLTRGEQERLVPIREEASIDETLLEDWTLAIEGELRSRGYRDAVVERRPLDRALAASTSPPVSSENAAEAVRAEEAAASGVRKP